jgi:hypothetical protein
MTDRRDIKPMSCEEFQSLLPELVGAEEDPARHPHVEGCELCRALIDDLNRIAEDARSLRGEADWL